MSLQARDMKLLEKIEELTLYIIQQQEKIEALNKENKHLLLKLSDIEMILESKKITLK